VQLIRAVPALFYLAICTYIGSRLCRLLLANLDGRMQSEDARRVAPWVISLPSAFLSGTLLVTWATYLVANLTRSTGSPMPIANVVVMGILLIALAIDYSRSRKNRAPLRVSPSRIRKIDIAVAALGLALGSVMMFHTCRIEGSTLVLGRTAFGDLNIHLGMTRSFSVGQNFPTGYMAYAGSDIRYHFMFYFLIGNLEFLGLPLDWAINLPSILAFASVLLMLHAIGSTVGRDARVGLVTVLFFLMRSSPAAFVYFARLSGGLGERIEAVFRTRKFIGLTTHETWGIWNLNTYVVERHFGFAFGLVLIALLYLIRITSLDSGLALLRNRRESSPS
jgi:hypothetical protein